MVLRETGRSSTARRRVATRAEEQPTVSYLVRFWLEPREKEGAASPLRGYARDLETGEERYFGDPRRFTEHVLRRLERELQETERRKAADAMNGSGRATG